MRPRISTSRLALAAVTAVAALSLVAGSAAAANDRGNGHGNGNGHRKYRSSARDRRYVERWREPRRVVVVAPQRRVYAQPVYVAHRPRYVAYRSPRVLVVRPSPLVRVGARFGSVDISAVFGGHRRYADYQYGCNFCEARYASFDAYDAHVHSCSQRPRNVQIRAEAWDDRGYDEWQGRDACDDGRDGGRAYDNGRAYDDDGYDDGGYDDGGYDNGDDN